MRSSWLGDEPSGNGLGLLLFFLYPSRSMLSTVLLLVRVLPVLANQQNRDDFTMAVREKGREFQMPVDAYWALSTLTSVITNSCLQYLLPWASELCGFSPDSQALSSWLSLCMSLARPVSPNSGHLLGVFQDTARNKADRKSFCGRTEQVGS